MVEYLSNESNGYRLKLVVTQLSQSVTENSSQVRIQLVFATGNNDFYSASSSSYVIINGQRYSWSEQSYYLTKNKTSTIIDKTVAVSHDSNGRKSFTVSAYFEGGSGGMSSMKSTRLTISEQSFVLAEITRTSTLTVGEGVIGSQLVMTINRPHNALTHTLRYQWGSKSGTIATNVGTSYTWTIPNDFATVIPLATSGSGILYLDTYSGSTKTGTQEVAFTAAVPASMKPSFSGVTLADGNRASRSLLTGNNFLQVISDIQVTFNGATGSYGSTITGYKAEIVNRNQVTTTNGGSLGVMKFNGSATIRSSVVDSRGRWSDTRDVTINVIEYFAPVFSFTALRTRENANTIQVVRNAKIAPVTLSGVQKNSMTLSFRVAPIGSTSYTTDTGSASATYTTQSSLVNSAANLGGNYLANKSYKIIGVLSDKFTSVEFSVDVSTESVVMGYDKDGRVGIGKPPEFGKAGSLDVAGDIYAGGKPIGHYSVQTVSDINTALSAGVYSFTDNTSNQPFGLSGWGYIEIIVTNGNTHNNTNNWIWQKYSTTSGKNFERYKINANNWTPWLAPGLNQFYPVGSIYQSTVNTSPATTMGGTWQQLTSQTLFGVTVYAWKRTA